MLLCVGGNDTLGVANRLYEEEGIKIIGVPQTIDNDLLETDYSIGFHSAVENIVNCVNMVMSSAMSHEGNVCRGNGTGQWFSWSK